MAYNLPVVFHVYNNEKQTVNNCIPSLSIERRINNDPVPEPLADVLTAHQMKALGKLESLDWFLWFVRRPTEQSAIPFLLDCDFSGVAIIEADGSLNTDHGLLFRWDLFY